MTALLTQGESHGYEAGPAARQALKALPANLAERVYAILTKKELLMRSSHDSLRDFVSATQEHWPAELASTLKDFAGMSHFDFVQKYWKD